MPLSSHPPSLNDLAAAAAASTSTSASAPAPAAADAPHPVDNTQEIVPAAVEGLPSQPSNTASQSSQEDPPLRRRRESVSHVDDPRRHGRVFNLDDGEERSPGHETTPTQSRFSITSLADSEAQRMQETTEDTPEENLERSEESASDSDLVIASTINRESTSVATGDQPIRPSPNNEQHDEDGKASQSETNDTDDAGSQQTSQAAESGSSFYGGVQGSRGNWNYSYEDEEYDAKDPRFDVEGAVRRYGSGGKALSRIMAAQGTPQPGNPGPSQPAGSTNVADNQYASLQRDFTNQSLVPNPLSTATGSRAHVASPAGPASTLPAPELARESALAADGDDDDDDSIDLIPDPEIPSARPHSFLIRGHPEPPPPNATSEQQTRHQTQWQLAPSPETINHSVQDHKIRRWKEEVGARIVEEARNRGKVFTEEEIARRVEKKYQRSSLFNHRLPPTTYNPQASPQQSGERAAAATAADPGPSSGRVRASLPPRPPRPPRPEGGLYSALARGDPPMRPEPAFASSQVLPLAATMASIAAHDDFRGGSPPPSPSPSPARRERNRFLRRHHQDPNLD